MLEQEIAVFFVTASKPGEVAKSKWTGFLSPPDLWL
eukprot:gene5050-7662_t